MRNKLLLAAAFFGAVLTSATLGYSQGTITPRPRPGGGGGGGIFIPECRTETVCDPCAANGRAYCCTFYKSPACNGNTNHCICSYDRIVCRNLTCV